MESILSLPGETQSKRPSALRWFTLNTVPAATGLVISSLFLAFIISQGYAGASPGHDGGHEGSDVTGTTSNFPIVTVEQPKTADSIQISIEAAGQIFAEQQADLYPLQDGVIQSLSANLGSRVRQGQVLGVLRPDQGRQELAAEIGFKQRELEISRERATLTTDAHLRTTQEERDAAIAGIQAEIAGMETIQHQKLQSMNNAAYDLLDSVNEMLFTRSDGIANYLSHSAFDYYRRVEAWPSFGNDATARESFERTLLAFRTMVDAGASDPMEMMAKAMEIGEQARRISLSISDSPSFPADHVDRIRKEIAEMTDHLSAYSTELTEVLAKRSSLEAEKRKIFASTEREIVEVKGEQRNADLDTEIIAAEIVQLQQQMGAGRTIVAPFSGIITKRYVSAGESVTADKPVFNLVDDRRKYIRFHISEADLPFIKIGTTVTFSPTSAPSEQFTAVIKRIAQAVDPESRTIQVEADVPTQNNAERILAQMTIRVQVPVTHNPSLLAIPEAALQLSKSSNVVWTVAPDVTAVAKEVEIAFIHSGYAYITSGLTAKDWIVVKSPVELSAGLAIDTKQL